MRFCSSFNQTCVDFRPCATQVSLWFRNSSSSVHLSSLSTRALPVGVGSSFRENQWHIQRTCFSSSTIRLRRYRPAFGEPYRPRYPRPRSETFTNTDQNAYRYLPARYGEGCRYQEQPHDIFKETVIPTVGIEPKTVISDFAESSTQVNVKILSQRLRYKRPRVPRRLQSIEALEEELQWRARYNPHPISIRAILVLLIRKHNVVPTQRHYEALILSNCSPDGSADNVGAILAEMEQAEIDLSVSVLTAALSALAIHPQPDLVAEITGTLNQRWSLMPPTMKHSLITLYIRMDQLELANALLNDLHTSQKPLQVAERTPVPRYLYIMFIQHLVYRKDYDAVIRFIYKLRDRNATDMDLPAVFWSWTLQIAAKDGDGWVGGWIWQNWVEKMRVKPSRETCYHTMKIASRDNIAWLAPSVRDTIEHGGVDIGFTKHSKNMLPVDSLSEEEETVLDSHKSHPYIENMDHAVVEDNTTDHDYYHHHHITSGNMWPFFNHDKTQRTGRIDPWNALGPKARRR